MRLETQFIFPVTSQVQLACENLASFFCFEIRETLKGCSIFVPDGAKAL